MSVKKRCCGLIVLMLLWIGTKAAVAQGLTAFDPVYFQLIGETSKHPQKVLTRIQNMSDKPASDTDKAQQHYVKSSAYYALTYPNEALAQAQLSLAAIDAGAQPWLYHQARLAESLALDLKGDPEAGLLGANAALVWGELQQREDVILNALYTRGRLLTSLVDYYGALRDLQKAYDMASVDEGLITQGHVAGLLALVYEYRGEDALAAPFFEQAAALHRDKGNWLELSVALYGLGRANKNLKSYALGRKQLLESAQLARKVGDKQGEAYALKELGGLALELDEPDVAMQLLSEAKDVFDLAQNRYMQFDTSLNLARVARRLSRPEEAEQWLQLAEGYLERASMPIQALRLDEQKAHLLGLKGEYAGAYQLLKQTLPAKEVLFNQRSTEQLHNLRAEYELTVKERENRWLEKQNRYQQANLVSSEVRVLQLSLLFIALLVICVLLIVLVYRTKQNRRALEKLANFDSLTGLANRRHTMSQLQSQLDLASRHNYQIAIAIADLDHFKQINDQFGHAAGDAVLKAFGQLCRGTLRRTDIVGRIGGEEFLLGLLHTSQDDAVQTLETLGQRVKELANTLNFAGLELSISSGVILVGGDTNITELMQKADNALYEAKHQGRDRVVVYHSANE